MLIYRRLGVLVDYYRNLYIVSKAKEKVEELANKLKKLLYILDIRYLDLFLLFKVRLILNSIVYIK